MAVDDHLAILQNSAAGRECDDPRYNPAKQLFFLVPLLYGLPTLILNGHMVVVFLSSKRGSAHSSSFYRIYTAASFATSIMWVWDMWTTRLPATGWACHWLLANFSNPVFWMAPFQFVMTYSRHAQFCLATAIAVNRLTAVLWPTRYERIWEGHRRWIIVVLYSLPLTTSWYLIPTSAMLSHYPLDGLTLTYIKILPNPWSSVTFMTAYLGLVCGLVILFSTLVTYYALIRYKRGGAESNLLVVGLISSITTFILAAVELPFFFMSNYFSGNNMDSYFLLTCLKQAIIDIVFVFSPWSLLLLSKSLRVSILALYGRKMKESDSGHASYKVTVIPQRDNI